MTLLPTPRPGPKRNQHAQLVALTYLLWPGERPHGLQKQLAYANGLTPQQLNRRLCEIRKAAR